VCAWVGEGVGEGRNKRLCVISARATELLSY
jgi:hypothetical protein